MTDKTMNQIEEMKKQTIGVEIEMNNITREKAARLAAEYFGTGRYEYTARRNGYETWSAWDAQGREWKMQKDVSIHVAVKTAFHCREPIAEREQRVENGGKEGKAVWVRPADQGK